MQPEANMGLVKPAMNVGRGFCVERRQEEKTNEISCEVVAGTEPPVDGGSRRSLVGL